jgi:dimethylaniline monooxygenase (N-oxide forming)
MPRTTNLLRGDRSTIINTCKEMMNFSDFLVPDTYPVFMGHAQCVAYFEQYAAHFGLAPHIRLRTRVLSVRPAHDYVATGRYTVRFQTEGSTGPTEAVFDAVLACTGHHARPKTPHFPGLDRFCGRTMHTHAYKDPSGFENKHVVVVGAGNSGTGCPGGRHCRTGAHRGHL